MGRKRTGLLASLQDWEGGCRGRRARLRLRERGQRRAPGRRDNRIDPEREETSAFGVSPPAKWGQGDCGLLGPKVPQPLSSGHPPGVVKTLLGLLYGALGREPGSWWLARVGTLQWLARAPLWRDGREGGGPGALPTRLPVGGGCHFSSWFSPHNQLRSPSPKWRLLGPEAMCFLHAWEWKSAVRHRLAGSLHRLPLALYWQRG